MAARRRRCHAGKVGQLLPRERTTAEQRGEDARPRGFAEEPGHVRQYVGVTHRLQPRPWAVERQGAMVWSPSKRLAWTRVRRARYCDVRDRKQEEDANDHAVHSLHTGC